MYIAWEEGSAACGLFVIPLFSGGVSVSVEAKKQNRSLYSDILISCSRRRQQYTKCTPTCIISTACPLVTSPFPQALSNVTLHSKIATLLNPRVI